MSITLGDSLKHNNPIFPIVDIEDVKGGSRIIGTFSNTDLYNAFNSIPDKLKQNYTSIIVTSTNQNYYLSGTDATVTTSWTLIGSGLSTSGTTNSVVKWTSSTSLGDSLITDNGDTITISGNLTVIGTSSTITSENLLVKDPIILLAGSQSTPLFDSGLFINRGTGDTQAFIWDESASEFSFLSTTSSSSTLGNVSIGTYSKVRTGPLSVGTGITSSSTLFVKGTTSSIMKVVGTGATWSNSASIFLVEDSGKVSIGPTFSSAFGGSPYNTKLDVNGNINTNSSIYSGGGYIFYDGGTGMLPGPSGNIRFISYGIGDAFKFEPQYTTSNFSSAGLGNNIQRIILQEYTIAASFSNNQIRMIELSPTINKTGTASGIDRGIYINPTLTNDITKFRSIEVTNGDVLFSTSGGNVGVGLTAPSTKLHVYATQSGAFRLQDGTEQNNYILKSDSNGVASWVSLSTIGISGASGSIPKFTGTSSLGNSRFFDDGTSGSYGSGTSQVYFLPGGNTWLTLNRSQSAMTFVLGNPQSPTFQLGQIQSTNTIGLSIESAGYTIFKIGASYNSSLTIDSDGVYNQIKGMTNTIYGYQTLLSATASSLNNTAFGYQALYANTANENVAFGYLSLRLNTSGTVNTAIGNYSLYFNTIGTQNTAVGLTSLYRNSSGYSNIAIGHQSLYSNKNGYSNVAVGNSSLFNNTTTIQSLSIVNGGSGYTASSTFSSVQLSYISGTTALSYPIITVYVGSGGTVSTVTLETNGSGFTDTTTIMGANLGTGFTFSVSITSLTSGISNTSIGYQSMYYNTSGIQNTSLGANSLFNNTTGNNNTSVGLRSLFFNTSGYQNTSIGALALETNTSGINNIAIGYATLELNSTGGYNTSIGSYAAQLNKTGSWNTTLGYVSSINNKIGNSNVTIGYGALYSATQSSFNTAIGNATLWFSQGSWNTALGYNSLGQIVTGSYNIGIGVDAGLLMSGTTSAATQSDNSIFIGYDTRPQASLQTNQIVIGYGATGSGSNSVTLGAGTITKTQLRGTINIGNVPQYASNGAAISGGLVPGDIYQTLSNVLMVVV